MTFRNKKALVVALIYVTVPVLVWLLPPVCLLLQPGKLVYPLRQIKHMFVLIYNDKI